jgi:hypothetical protein
MLTSLRTKPFKEGTWSTSGDCGSRVLRTSPYASLGYLLIHNVQLPFILSIALLLQKFRIKDDFVGLDRNSTATNRVECLLSRNRTSTRADA